MQAPAFSTALALLPEASNPRISGVNLKGMIALGIFRLIANLDLLSSSKLRYSSGLQ
jgi:hypothetical protein